MSSERADKLIRAVDRPTKLQRFLGDGVYAAFDGFGVWLTAEDGTRATDAIYLEPAVFEALERFMDDAMGDCDLSRLLRCLDVIRDA